MLKFIDQWINKGLRKLDVIHLWPILKEQGDIDQARRAFKLHTQIDPVWHDLTEAKIDKIIGKLK